ncbi:hypothetical protein AVEN_102357-1 [Araneus ventricosus]|uniref:DDE-1 domain-containing protein n=1 Tax=Araneus ventricosus TaxID=182803 RepID=A0A4Y2N730_ARAVE|nr:hypothetical protein AVEN_102357-1 [Araneus ventricosus]
MKGPVLLSEKFGSITSTSLLVKMIENTWERVTKRTLTSAWKNLLPEKNECDFEEFGTVPVGLSVSAPTYVPVYNIYKGEAAIISHRASNTLETALPAVIEIVSLAKIMGVENDTDELEEDLSRELTSEELTELHCVSQQEVLKERRRR